MLSEIELFFVEQAIYKGIAEDVSTKNAGNLRDKVDAAYIDMYEKVGSKSFEARVADVKVGTVSVRVTDEKVKSELVVENADDALDWAIKNGCIAIDLKVVNRHFTDTGELPDGFSLMETVTPRKVGTSVRIDPEKVMDALGGELLPVMTRLLEA